MKNYEKENKTPKVKVLGEETLEEVKKEEKKVFRLKAIMDYLGNHKTQIIMILGALITLFTSLEVLGGKAAIYCTIIVAFIELVIFYIKNGLTETFLEMCVNTVMLIVNVINGTYTVDKTVTVEKESRDADNNVIGGFNPATGELTLGNNNEYNFLFSDKNEFIKPEDLSKISSAQYKLSTDGQSGTITIFDGDAQYNLDLQLDKNGKFLINNGDATIGTFDPKTNSITINNETGNDKTFAFTEAKDNKLVNLGDFEVSSAHINVNNGSNLITLVGKDGKEYSFDLTNPNEEGICEIKDVDGNKIGSFNSKTSELTIGEGGQSQVYDNFVMTNDGQLIDPKDMKIVSGSYNLKDRNITFTDAQGNDYKFGLGELSGKGTCEIMSNGTSVGLFNLNSGTFSFNNTQENLGKFIFTKDNQFINQENFDPKAIEIKVSTAEDQSDKILITNSDGTKYEFDAVLNKNSESLYDIKDAFGNKIGSFDSKTGEYYKGTSQENPIQFAKSTDGTYVDTSKLEVEDIKFNEEAGTINIIDKDGTSATFKVEDIDGDGKFIIKDANGNEIGHFTPGDVESSLTFNGQQSTKVDTLSEENKNMFNTIFENNRELSNYIKNGDYEGLKEALKDTLEETIGKDNPELLEKTQKVVDDMDLDGVKTKEEFLGALNKSLDDNGFDTVEDIKVFPSLEEILTHPAAIAGYSIATIILAALIRMLLKQILQKQQEEEQEKNQSFDINSKSNKGKSYENNIVEKNASDKKSKHTVSSPDDLNNINYNEQGKSK